VNKELTPKRQPPLYVIIGTRGQFIKTAPVLRAMSEKGIPFRLINTGQHTVSSLEIAEIFNISGGDAFVARRGKDIEKISEAGFWFLKTLLILIFKRKNFFVHGKGLVVIHGDTLSTLLALVVSRLMGMKVAHIESGLRSHSFFHPFPEEIIRILSCRFSHYLFAPSETAYDNLHKHSGVKYNTKGNTVFDAIKLVKQFNGRRQFDFPYCVVTIHRSEVLFREDLTKIALQAVYEAAKFIKVIFVVHKVTLARLKAFDELTRLMMNDNILLEDYFDYPSFMSLVQNAKFVMTDGGGLQEETFYLNVPCLILRKKTERNFGLGTTAFLSELRKEKIDYFLQNYNTFKRNEMESDHPSKFIAEKLLDLI
jgi:UDP-N-acetylglucosamine 2-epimerase (non-hydrolysing)